MMEDRVKIDDVERVWTDCMPMRSPWRMYLNISNDTGNGKIIASWDGKWANAKGLLRTKD